MLEYGAIVIGGGVSGLTSALLLARRGYTTAVLEASGALMPLVRGFEREGVRFETGFHYTFGLGEGDIGPYLFQELGLDIQSYPLPRDGYDEIHLPSGRVFKMAYGRDRLEENLVRAFPDEKAGIRTYLDRTEAAIHASDFLNLHKNKNAGFDAAADTGETLRDVLDEVFTSGEIKSVFAAAAALHGTPPSKVSFQKHSCMVGGLFSGAYGIAGGGTSILRAYEAALTKAGVHVYLGAEAASIRVSDENGKKHITANGKTFTCDICVASVHPKRFLEIAPENVYREGYKARMREREETPGIFAVYGVLNAKTRFSAGNIFLVTGSGLDAMYVMSGGSRSYSIILSEASPQAVIILSFVPPDEAMWDRNAPEYTEKKNAYAAGVRADIQRLLPELAENIEYLSVSTPASSYRFVGYYGGYGIMHDVSKTELLPVTKINGLYLTGQAVATPGFFGAISASIIVDRVAGKATRPM